MKKFISLLICMGIIGAYAQNISLTPNKWNTIYYPQNLSNGTGDWFFAGNNQSSISKRGLLHFQLSNIPDGATITNVKLNLYMDRSQPGTYTVKLHKLTKEWGQGQSNAPDNEGSGTTSAANDANWLCNLSDGTGGCTSSWTTPGGDFYNVASAVASVDGIGPYSWSGETMINDVQGWLDNPSINFGWIIIGDESLPETAKRFNATGINAPTLEITYTTNVGVIKNEISKALVIYPNPTSGEVIIDMGEKFNNILARVTNINGQFVSSKEFYDRQMLEINLNDATGYYFVELVTSKNTRAIIKILKE